MRSGGGCRPCVTKERAVFMMEKGRKVHVRGGGERVGETGDISLV